MDAEIIVAEAQALSTEIGAAIDTILDAAEAALDAGADSALAARLHAIVLACGVHDLAGQRLSRIVRIAKGEGAGATDAMGLLNGPQAPGRGLDQAAADALLWAPANG